MNARNPLRRSAPVAHAILACGLVAAAMPAPAFGQFAKAPMCGLETMGNVHFRYDGSVPTNALEEEMAHPGVYTGTVVQILWSQLEGMQRGTFDNSAIEQALTNIAQYNTANQGHPLQAKLRVYGGVYAPEWAKGIDGGSSNTITVYDQGTTAETIGPFWETAYQQAWTELQTWLAKTYDTDPRIQEVVVTSCGTLDDEQFNLPTDSRSLDDLYHFVPTLPNAPAFSDGSYQYCLSNSLQPYAAWKYTPLDMAFNAFRSTAQYQTMGVVLDSMFTNTLMQRLRHLEGASLIISNHGIVFPAPKVPPESNQEILNVLIEINKLSDPIAFQLGTITGCPAAGCPGGAPGNETTFDAALQAGFIKYDPTEFELFDSQEAANYGGQGDGDHVSITKANLEKWAAEFKCTGQ